MTERVPHRHVEAAGAVLWRRGEHGVEVAVVHRPRYDDWSLPKGKVDPGETAVVAAVREIAEETGVRARLGRHVTRVTYPLSGNRIKRVHYWAAEALDAGAETAFTPNDEVDQLRWLPVAAAARLLTYETDRDVLAEFGRLPADTRSMLLVRHAKAGSRARYLGEDRMRPLEDAGRAQARALVPNLAAFGARFVHSADPVRCIQTVTPAAEFLGTHVVVEPAMSESAYAADPYAAEVTIRKIAALGDVRVVCSQGKVIPGLLRSLAERDAMALPTAPTRKASCWVLSLHEGRFVAADYLDSPLPAR